jgi:DNA-binding LacI/PurR family transcriptional regulator
LVDVATAAGVSRSTASRAINDHPRVAPEVRQRVRKVVEELGYRPDPTARALATGAPGRRTDTLELIVVEDCTAAFGANPFYGRVLEGVLDALRDSDARMRVHVLPGTDAPRALAELSRTTGLGALLVNVDAPLAKRFHQRCPRVVSLGRSAPFVPFTEPENLRGGRMAVRHLIQSGRRRIVAIDGKMHLPCAADRHTGYVHQMREAGLRPLWAVGDYSREGGAAATQRLLAEEPDLDAIFAACDLSAVGALQALTEAGRRVPDDVAVVGFDGSLLAACTNPPLTSVWQPVEKMTATAVRQLLADRVQDRWYQSFPVTLSVRQSTAA